MNRFPTSYSFASRYGQIRSVTRIDPKRYIVEGETLYTRASNDPQTNFSMADFEGGPCLISGDSLEQDIGHFPITDSHMIVKSVAFVSPEDAADLMGFTDSAVVQAFSKSDYAYVLVEVE
jgi:hypothetical protein